MHPSAGMKAPMSREGSPQERHGCVPPPAWEHPCHARDPRRSATDASLRRHEGTHATGGTPVEAACMHPSRGCAHPCHARDARRSALDAPLPRIRTPMPWEGRPQKRPRCFPPADARTHAMRGMPAEAASMLPSRRCAHPCHGRDAPRSGLDASLPRMRASLSDRHPPLPWQRHPHGPPACPSRCLRPTHAVTRTPARSPRKHSVAPLLKRGERVPEPRETERARSVMGRVHLYPSTSDRASSPQPSIATKSSSLNGKLTCVGLIICIPSARSTFEITRSMTRNGR